MLSASVLLPCARRRGAASCKGVNVSGCVFVIDNLVVVIAIVIVVVIVFVIVVVIVFVIALVDGIIIVVFATAILISSNSLSKTPRTQPPVVRRRRLDNASTCHALISEHHPEHAQCGRRAPAAIDDGVKELVPVNGPTAGFFSGCFRILEDAFRFSLKSGVHRI
jgi:hypothetical protein